MRLKAPDFWYDTDSFAARLRSAALRPLSWLYRVGQMFHQKQAPKPYQADIPVLCIGNLTVGGSGKTPTVIAIINLLKEIKVKEAMLPYVLTRGYGGTERGPTLVDLSCHNAATMGEEPLLLAQKAPVIVAADRAAGAQLAQQKGADIIIMDDGLQNSGLIKTLSFVVIDGGAGFGNAMTLPAGPLREPLKTGFARADGFILIGEDKTNALSRLPDDKPIFKARITPQPSSNFDPQIPYIAFAGLGRPEKFKETLAALGANIVSWHPFPDHHFYNEKDLEELSMETKILKARLITTEKDAIKLPVSFMKEHAVDTLPISLTWDKKDKESLEAFIKQKLKKTI